MSAVLVTGATGNVGIQLITQLNKRGISSKAAIRSGSDMAAATTDSVLFDFNVPATYNAALEGVDQVFLVRPPQMSLATAFKPFIDAMVTAQVKQVVFLSVQGAGQNIFVPHHGIEKLLKKSGLNWTFLRPSFFMQNLSTTHLADIRDRGEVYVPAGGGRTNFIDVADIAEAAAVCLTTSGHEHKAYEITGSEALTYDQIAEILSVACKRTIIYPRPSAKQFKTHMKQRGYDDDFVSVVSSIYAIARYGMAAGTTDDFEKLVGRKPHTFSQWASQNHQYWESRSGA